MVWARLPSWRLALLGLALLVVVVFACRGVFPASSPESAPPTEETGSSAATLLPSPSPSPLPSPTLQPALPPPVFPTLLPTPVPTLAPQPTPGSSIVLPKPTFDINAGIAAEVWDFPSGKYQGQEGGARYPKGGDVYAFNLYERPFREGDQAEFYPDLDIRYARLVRKGEWFYAVIRLHGLASQATAPQGDYGIEIDVDIDGRGEFLVWARGPIPDQWTPLGVEVYQDSQSDVGGQLACQSEAPLRGDGYDHLVYQAHPATALAWVRWDWEQEGSERYPSVFLAFHQSVLGTPPDRFLWQAWADGGLQQPGAMAYHDQYTRSQAGVPYPKQTDFPIKDLARMDNTCRTAFGFELTGMEPCLCQNNATVPVCPQPEAPPMENCQLGPDGLWTCIQEVVDAQAQVAYCRWDDTLCQWDCRPTRMCLPSLAVPPPAGTGAQPSGDDNVTLLPWADPAAGVLLPPPGVVVADLLQPPFLEIGILREGNEGKVTQCNWDPDLCRWDCIDVCLSIPEAPRPDCTYQGNETWLCDDGIGQRTTYRWNQGACRWDTETEQYCPPPADPPHRYPRACKQTSPGVWECIRYTDTGVYVIEYRWDEKACKWNQGLLCSRDPREDCIYNTEDTTGYPWRCPGRGVFKECKWDSTQCRDRCWGPKPQPKREEERVCQAADFCSQDGALWYCQDGTSWEVCTYDGCTWTCE